MTKLSRNEVIILAAKKRAAICRVISTSDKPVTIPEFLNDPEIKNFKFIHKTLAAFLAVMKVGKIIDSVKDDESGNKVGYIMFGTKTSAIKKVVTKQNKPVTDAKMNLKVSIVKKTGNVRLEFNGLLIEIGVIE